MKKLAAALLLVTLALGGCSFNASLTASPDRVADAAAASLADQLGGETPQIDCGDDAVPLVAGTTVDCVLTDPASGSDYATVVTIGDVDGAKFAISVQVAGDPL